MPAFLKDGDTGLVLDRKFILDQKADAVFNKENGRLKLVFLNGCDMIDVGEQIYKKQNTETAIYWDTKVESKSAKVFAELFYRLLKTEMLSQIDNEWD